MATVFAALPVKVLVAPTETVTAPKESFPVPAKFWLLVVKVVGPVRPKEARMVTLFCVIPPLNSLGEVEAWERTPVVTETVTAPTKVFEPKLSLSLKVPVIVIAPVTVKADWYASKVAPLFTVSAPVMVTIPGLATLVNVPLVTVTAPPKAYVLVPKRDWVPVKIQPPAPGVNVPLLVIPAKKVATPAELKVAPVLLVNNPPIEEAPVTPNVPLLVTVVVNVLAEDKAFTEPPEATVTALENVLVPAAFPSLSVPFTVVVAETVSADWLMS